MREIGRVKKILLIAPYFVHVKEICNLAEALRREFPKAQLTLVIATGHRSSEELSLLDKKTFWDNLLLIGRKVSYIFSIWYLRKEKFDLAILISSPGHSFPQTGRAMAFLRLSRARERKIGYLSVPEGRIRLISIEKKDISLVPLIPKIFLLLIKPPLFFLHLLRQVLTTMLSTSPQRKIPKEEQSIVCFCMMGLGDLYQRPHHIMSRLSREKKVLYIGPPVSIWSGEYLYTPLNRTISLHKVKENFLYYNPLILSRKILYLYSTFGKLDKISTSIQIRYLFRKLGLFRPVLYFAGPGWGGIEKYLDKGKQCYDCFDDYSAFSHLPTNQTRAIIEDLVKNSELVIASSRHLYVECRKKNPHTFLIRNGVDAEHFLKAVKKPAQTIPAISHIPRPIIGYHGSIAEWLDWELVDYVASQCPQFSIVFIGPVQCDLGKIRQRNNVYFLGKKEYSVLPYYISFFDVGIIPFKITPLTLPVNPIKLYEYLCMGKPVVSVDIPEVRRFREYVKIAYSREDFLAKILESLEEKDPLLVKKRKELALRNSWEKRVKIISRLLAS